MKWHYKLFLSFLLVTATITGWAQRIPPAPNPPKLVNDFADVLSSSQEQQLESHLLSYNDTTSNEIAIVLVNTLDDYPIEEYATRLYREWGIGNNKYNNGVLILAAIKDRKIRIEVGYGLEGAIPDITANHIIAEDIGPNFRSGDYYEGLRAAADHIIDAAKGEYKATSKRKRSSGSRGLPIGLIILVIVMIVAFSNRRGGGGGGFMSRRGYRGGGLGPFILGSMLGGSSGGWGGGGGGGWSGGGGGFGGFGGGSSGGGGASGSW